VKQAIPGLRTVMTIGVALFALGAALVSVVALVPPASGAGESIAVAPHIHLKAAEKIEIRGSGFAHGSNGAVLECNNSPGEPAVIITIHGLSHAVPVGCTEPVELTTTKIGKLGSKSMTVVVGTLGSWETGDDSSGTPAAADSASYPCPPTPSQSAVGISCDVEFLDNKGQVATRSVAFSS
jgi:hypothetical protein